MTAEFFPFFPFFFWLGLGSYTHLGLMNFFLGFFGSGWGLRFVGFARRIDFCLYFIFDVFGRTVDRILDFTNRFFERVL
jgi:hypothetical protein